MSLIQEKARTYFARDEDIGNTYELENFKSYLDQEFKGSCIAIVTVIAERDRAYEVAKQEIRRAVDLLRYTNKLFTRNNDTRIGLRGDYPRALRRTLIFSEKTYWQKSESIGSNQFQINQNVLDIMQAVGIFKLADAFFYKTQSDFQEAIFKSIHWFSMSFTQDEKDNALLCLIISLESIFKSETWSSISGTVAESSAFILADEISNRKKIIRKVKDFYGKRSNIAHGGKKAEKSITDSDLSLLTQLVLAVIEFCLGKMDEFRSRDDLTNWIQDLKLS